MYLNMESDEIRRMCGDPAVYTRGRDYMVRGKVKKITYEPLRLSAVVQGSQDYMVHVQHNGRKIQFPGWTDLLLAPIFTGQASGNAAI